MKILITGASGLLGLNLTLEAAGMGVEHMQHPLGAKVIGVVNQNLPNIPNIQYLSADLLAPNKVEQLFEEIQPDWVIHCAALANVDACEKDPGLAHRLNTELPGKLARLVSKGGSRLLHISTDAVFDGVRGNYSEIDAPNPLSIYAKSKLAGEQAVLDANSEAIVARVNMFGWSRSGTRSLAEFFFNNLSVGKTVQGFTDAFFCPLFVNDLGNILIKMLENKLSGLYHVVSPTHLSKYDFGLAIARKFGLDARLLTPASVQSAVKTGSLTAVRSPNLTLRVEKLATDFRKSSDKSDLPTWESGLEKFFRLYQQGYPQKLKSL